MTFSFTSKIMMDYVQFEFYISNSDDYQWLIFIIFLSFFNRMNWMFRNSDLILPSVYLSEQKMSSAERQRLWFLLSFLFSIIYFHSSSLIHNILWRRNYYVIGSDWWDMCAKAYRRFMLNFISTYLISFSSINHFKDWWINLILFFLPLLYLFL
jgi:hypothetical protein